MYKSITVGVIYRILHHRFGVLLVVFRRSVGYNKSIIRKKGNMEQDTNRTAVPNKTEEMSVASEGQASVRFYDKPKKSKGLIAAVVIFALLAAVGVGFGVYGMFFNNSQKPSTSDNNDVNGGSSVEEPDAIAEVYEERDIREKTLRLLGERNGLSDYERYNSEDRTFVVNQDYMPISALLANGLTEEDKVYIVLETTGLDSKYCATYNEAIKADINNLGITNAEWGDGTFDCISYRNANLDYQDLFGGTIPKITTMTQDYVYGANSDTYLYHILGGRGGASAAYITGKIDDYNVGEDEASIDVRMGKMSINMNDGVKLYGSVLGSEAIRGYGAEVDISDIVLSDEDYEKFEKYRFVFENNGNNIYSFSKVEQL